jgi:UDP-N-acetylglucosamine 4-epimerase
LNQLFNYLKDIEGSNLQPIYGPERKGDVKHSLADINKAKDLLGYDPVVTVGDGLKKIVAWYKTNNE